ncbi:MAG TPA: TolC family protein [bacterium]|nr:TolC family protein [bacterium]
MSLKILKIMAAALAAGAVVLSTGALNADQFLSLPALIEQALRNNPGVAASSSSVDAAKAKVPQAGALPDPMLMLGVMSVPVDTFKLNQEPMTQIAVGVSQTIPYPGKLGDMSKAAQAGSQAAEYRDAAARQQAVALVRMAYYDLVFVDRAIAITDRDKELMGELSRIAAARYAVGMGIQQDVLKAQVELSRMIDQQIMYDLRRAQKAAELTRLINADRQQPVAGTRPASTLPPLPGREELFLAARQNNPMVLAQRSMADQARKEEALARLAWKPDVTVGVNYGFRQDTESGGMTKDTPDLLSASVGIPIPLWKKNKQDQEVAEKEARQKAAQDSAADVETQVIARVDQALAEAGAARQRITLLETGIIPQAEKSLESARAGYQTGKVDFVTMLDNQITLYKLELQLVELKSGYLKALAELDMLTGKPIDEIMKGAES